MSKYEKKSSMVFTYLFLSLFALLCLLPFWYVITISFSNPSLVREGEIHLLPVGFNLKA